MANYKKSFNFKNGVQVDVDNFVVNSIGNVGIGTSAPGQLLDVYGTTRVSGLTTTTTLAVTGNAQFYSDLKVGTAVTISNGIVTATSYYGDGTKLSGIVGYHTTAWNLGAVGLTTTTPIGIGTDTAIASYDLVVGGDPNSTSGISLVKEGNLKSSGTITATGGFIGTVRASDLTGTIDNARLPSTITSDITGDLTGTATTAQGLTGTPNISVGVLTATTLDIDSFTISNDFIVNGKVGIGTSAPTADLEILNSSSNAKLDIISTSGASSRISIGNSANVSTGTSVALFEYNNQELRIKNKGTGSIEMYLHTGDLQPGITTGSYEWRYRNQVDPLAILTYEGYFGISQATPTANLHVGGTTKFGGDVELDSSYNFTVNGTLTIANSATIKIPQKTQTELDNFATNDGTFNGQLAYNSTTNTFVGYAATGWVHLH